MEKPSTKCALLATLVARHRWGSPMDSETLLALSDVRSYEYSDAREVLDELRRTSYITSYRTRGRQLENGGFGTLANVLYDECNWRPFEIKLRLKHYEGWSDHDWA